eukprot:10691226-Ditylum_brightwellii.AAC.1
METITNKEDNLYAPPNMITYNVVLNAWCKSGDHPKQLIARTQDLYDSGKEKLKPNTMTINSAIVTWAKSREGLMGACQAEMLLQLTETRYEAGVPKSQAKEGH